MPHPQSFPALRLSLLLLLPAACAGNGMATVTADGGASNPYTADGNHDECGNGMDDDGDGQIDEGCFCGSGETQSCFTGIYPERDIGACADGVQECVTEGSTEFGHWGPCVGDTVASEEICEGAVDEDCDGAVDESCPCTEGFSQECGIEFAIAPCYGGIQTCRDGAWTACEGAIGPSAEVCDDEVDNDCDGETNEGCGCVPVPEICGDGVDNDCDGDIDEPACGGMSGIDGGRPEVDAGTPEFDAGTPEVDAGTPEVDAGTPEVDAGTVGPNPEPFDTCGGTAPAVCSERATGIVDIDGRGWPFCARHQDGRVFCWGLNDRGAMGVGDPDLAKSATPLQAISGAQLMDVSENNSNACVIVGGGQVKCWGQKDWSAFPEHQWSPATPPEAAGLTNIVDIAADGFDHFAQDADGTIWAWGYDGFGGLGDGFGGPGFGGLTQVAGIRDAIALDAGSRTNCVVRADGSVWCWGLGHHGEAGPPGSPTGVVNPVHDPTKIAGIDDAVDVQLGHEVACALRETGEVSCWGSNGQRGDGSGWTSGYTTSAAPVPGLTDVRTLVAGYYPMCAIKCNGELWCWGVINGKPEYSVPRRITGIGPVTDVALVQYPEDYGRGIRGNICVLEECGRVLCWGQNASGEAASGTFTPVSAPAEVVGLP